MQGGNIIWTRELIERLRSNFQDDVLYGGYGKREVQAISRHIDEYMLNNVMT